MSEREITELPTRRETEAEATLHAWWTEQRARSVDNLEAAARQIVTLSSALLTTLLSLLALSNATLPVYMTWTGIQWLGGGGVVGLCVALGCALATIYPRPQRVMVNDPAAERQAFEALLQRKSRRLAAALWSFGAALACLGAVVVVTLAALV